MTLAGGIAGVFDRVADTYDNVGVDWFRPIAAGLVDELAAQPGECVLDIGCGRGGALEPLARAAVDARCANHRHQGPVRVRRRGRIAPARRRPDRRPDRAPHRTVEATFHDVDHLLEFTWSHGQRAMWEAVPETDHGDVRQRIVEAVRGFTDDDGALTFHQGVRYTLGRRPPT